MPSPDLHKAQVALMAIVEESESLSRERRKAESGLRFPVKTISGELLGSTPERPYFKPG